MGTTRVGRVFVAAAVGLAAGCVDRRFVVETSPPGAQVYVDGAQIGTSPADAPWEYALKRRVTAVAPGYEARTEVVNFAPKWYEFPPFDLFAEVLYPFRIEDRRVVTLTLERTRPVNEEALVGAGDLLRARGQTLPPTKVPPSTRRPATALPPPLPTGTGGFSPLPNNFNPGATLGGALIPSGTPDRGDQTSGQTPPGADPPAPAGPPSAGPAPPPVSPIGPAPTLPQIP